MGISIATLCDPSAVDSAEAIRHAKVHAQAGSGFDVDLSRFLQTECLSSHVRLPVVFRGLEVLEAITEQSKLLILFRPFFRSSDPQIFASKSVLVLGRRCQNLGWIKSVIAEVDALNPEPTSSSPSGAGPSPRLNWSCAVRSEIPTRALLPTLPDGLYLLGSPEYSEGLDDLGVERERGQAALRHLGDPFNRFLRDDRENQTTDSLIRSHSASRCVSGARLYPRTSRHIQTGTFGFDELTTSVGRAPSGEPSPIRLARGAATR